MIRNIEIQEKNYVQLFFFGGVTITKSTSFNQFNYTSLLLRSEVSVYPDAGPSTFLIIYSIPGTGMKSEIEFSYQYWVAEGNAVTLLISTT